MYRRRLAHKGLLCEDVVRLAFDDGVYGGGISWPGLVPRRLSGHALGRVWRRTRLKVNRQL